MLDPPRGEEEAFDFQRLNKKYSPQGNICCGVPCCFGVCSWEWPLFVFSRLIQQCFRVLRPFVLLPTAPWFAILCGPSLKHEKPA